jgi:hypothetical protein
MFIYMSGEDLGKQNRAICKKVRASFELIKHGTAEDIMALYEMLKEKGFIN